MKRLLCLASVLALSACQAGSKSGNEAAAAPAGNLAVQPTGPPPAEASLAEAGANSAGASAAAPGEAGLAVPAAYDWSYTTHGGQADFWFGDGDWAEGDSLLSFSCLPGSREVRLADERPAVLRAGGETLTIRQGDPAPASHPVFQALKSGGTLARVEGQSERVLAAKDEGRSAIRQFFDYCG